MRKLSSALALITCPNCAFFDEPSVGLDPANRRKLWKALRLMLNSGNGCIILSTHRMDEAEALCDRLGILICGKEFAEGSPVQLKRYYGKGYRFYIKTKLIVERCQSIIIHFLCSCPVYHIKIQSTIIKYQKK